MQLTDVYEDPAAVYGSLYRLIKQRQPVESISHVKMPTWNEHCDFVDSEPYQYWYLITIGEAGRLCIGTIYLTHQREIGVFIHSEFRGNGYAREAVEMIRGMHPGRILANVNPDNEPSRNLWESMGGKLIQVTYTL